MVESNETLLMRIVQLEADVLYWKKAHLELQTQVIQIKESLEVLKPTEKQFELKK